MNQWPGENPAPIVSALFDHPSLKDFILLHYVEFLGFAHLSLHSVLPVSFIARYDSILIFFIPPWFRNAD